MDKYHRLLQRDCLTDLHLAKLENRNLETQFTRDCTSFTAITYRAKEYPLTQEENECSTVIDAIQHALLSEVFGSIVYVVR